MKLETDIHIDGIDADKVIFNDGVDMMEHLTYPFMDGLKIKMLSSLDSRTMVL